MSVIDALAEELRQESVMTRQMIERIPSGRMGWQPHAKSMSLGRLGSHLTELLNWVGLILDGEEFVLDPTNYRPYIAESPGELLGEFDVRLARALETMKGRSDEWMARPWKLKMGEHVIFEHSRATVIRLMILSHTIHHRGQMCVYLRQCDVPLPAIYGPTADMLG